MHPCEEAVTESSQIGHPIDGWMPQSRGVVTTRSVRVTVEGDECVVVTVRGCLDTGAAIELESVVAELIAAVPRGLDIDLREVTTWSEEGAEGLVRCHRLAAVLADGLRYRTGAGPGHDALLAAYANLT